jgi:hypothetical protein
MQLIRTPLIMQLIERKRSRPIVLFDDDQISIDGATSGLGQEGLAAACGRQPRKAWVNMSSTGST